MCCNTWLVQFLFPLGVRSKHFGWAKNKKEFKEEVSVVQVAAVINAELYPFQGWGSTICSGFCSANKSLNRMLSPGIIKTKTQNPCKIITNVGNPESRGIKWILGALRKGASRSVQGFHQNTELTIFHQIKTIWRHLSTQWYCGPALSVLV